MKEGILTGGGLSQETGKAGTVTMYTGKGTVDTDAGRQEKTGTEAAVSGRQDNRPEEAADAGRQENRPADGAAFREALARGPVLFDGAMGTYFASLYGHSPDWCDMAGLNRPEEITAIHRAYLEAGCQAVKTNTFSVSRYLFHGNTELARRILEAGCRTAREAAEPWGAFVFGDIGPAPEEEEIRGGKSAAENTPADRDRRTGRGDSLSGNIPLSPAEIYIRQADAFLKEGVTCFLVETQSSDAGIPELARFLKERCPASFLLVSYAVGQDRMTRAGYAAGDLLRRGEDCGDIDALGFNCVSGPEHLLQLVRGLHSKLPLSIMPNAGYPGILGRHTVFQGQPDYFGGKLREIVEAGASIVGGCCGTTPAHIAAASAAIRSMKAAAVRVEDREEPVPASGTDPFGEKLEAGQRVIAVELDPPADDDGGYFLDGAKRLRDAGADIITIADCPVGRARADSSLMACMLKREGVEPLPHMTCRDRNLNATKALLLGLAMGDVRNILLVTGDPIPTDKRGEIKSVFNFNSRKLARYIRGLYGNGLRTPPRMFGALNVNARNFDAQLFSAKEKEASGMAGFLTQPVLSPEALDNLKLARETLKGKILGGVFPVVSHKNAVFLNNEVAGIRVSEEIVNRYEGKSREEGEELAVELSVRTAADMAPWTDGVYLVTPFRRVALMERILAEILK